MIRTACFSVMMLALLCIATVTKGQPILDRVLDGVQNALDDPNRPIPVAEDAGNPLAEPAATAQSNNEPGYLGVIADDRQDGGRGVRLLEVVAGSPAAQAGLKKDDLITSIGDMPVRSMEEMAKTLSVFNRGEELKFVVLRGDTAKTIRVTLGERPGPEGRRLQNFGKQPDEADQANTILPPPIRPKLGVRTLPVTDQAQRQFNLPSRNGAIVVSVTPGSPADRAGLRQGAVITELNGQMVHSPDHLAELVAGTSGDFDLAYIADGRPARTKVTFGDAPATRVVEPPAANLPEPDDRNSRLDAIERRLQQLEDRIQKLEEK
jgi:predicted metalloprotease with PDZ domain